MFEAFLLTIAAAQAVVPVEIWVGGDDGLTQRLADAVRAEFKQSPNFKLSSGQRSGTLRVTIPNHAGWSNVGGVSRVTYKVAFEQNGREAAQGGGNCPEDDLSACAHQIVKQAAETVSR